MTQGMSVLPPQPLRFACGKQLLCDKQLRGACLPEQALQEASLAATAA